MEPSRTNVTAESAVKVSWFGGQLDTRRQILLTATTITHTHVTFGRSDLCRFNFGSQVYNHVSYLHVETCNGVTVRSF